MMKKFLASATAAVFVTAGLLVGASAASATTEPCVPSEAWTETVEITPAVEAVPEVPAVPEVLEVSHVEYQRYSWIGGPTEGAPAELPPTDNWQPNTTDYAGAGHSSDPIGAAFQKDNPGNGNADWYYWASITVITTPYQAGVPAVPGKPAVPAVTEEVLHEAVTCEEDPEPEVTAVACVGAGDWYTEGDDLAPVATPEGLVFAGGSGQAVGLRVPVTGNLQGWTSASFDADGGTEQFFFRIVIDASADGGPAYKSLSFPGYSTIDQDSVNYQYGETLAQTAERFPNNVITSVGFQTNSGAPADFSATLRSFSSDCGNVDWTYTEVIVPEQPEDRVVVTEVPTTDCDAKTVTTVTTTTTYPTTYDEYTNSWVEGEGVVVVTSSTRAATAEECPVVIVTPTPEPEETPAPVPAAAEELATTGSDTNFAPAIWVVALTIGGGIAFLVIAALRRRFGTN